MDKFSKTSKSLVKIYLIITSLVIGIIILIIAFKVLPQLEETLGETLPDQAEKMKSRVLKITIYSLIFIFLMNIYFWKIDDELTKEEKEAQTNLQIDPNNPIAKEKLKQLERKRKLYIAIIKSIFLIIMGLIVGFLFYIELVFYSILFGFLPYTVVAPLYRLLGTF